MRRPVAALVLPLFLSVLSLWAAERVPPAAESAVREALQREVHGLAADRQELLAAALDQAPQYAPARWHLGYIRSGSGWQNHRDALQSPQQAALIAQYEARRSRADDTVSGQLQLADWCAAHKLSAQERAHLHRVLDLAVDHPAARARLGFVRQGAHWIGADEIARERTLEAARQASIVRWQPVLAEIRKDLEHASPKRRQHGRQQLLEITDPQVADAIEPAFAGASDEVALAALDALAAIPDPAAAMCLARFAVHWPTLPVREAAAQRLKERPAESYVPALVASLSSPISSRFVAATLPNGRIGYRHVFSREAQQEVELVTLDTEVQRVARFGGNGQATTRQAYAGVAAEALAREQTLARQNEFINRTNDRICWVLKIATGQDLPANANAWWQWWNDYNEVFIAGIKPTSLVHHTQQVALVDYVPPARRSSQSGDASFEQKPEGPPATGGPTTQTSRPRSRGIKFGNGAVRSFDCLAAGTIVWTMKGPQEIEKIRLGDLVLSQDCESGELTYKPVLRTTVRPAGPLMKIEAGGETIETSGGHPFFVAGEGWVKARDLVSGQILHGAAGPVHVTSVEPGGEAETYNLVVDDFATYFVGHRQIMSHDNTLRNATRALVPGLLPE